MIFNGPLQIEFEQLNDSELKFHLPVVRKIVGFVVFQYVYVPVRVSGKKSICEKFNKKFFLKHSPIYCTLDDGIMQYAFYVSGVFAR